MSIKNKFSNYTRKQSPALAIELTDEIFATVTEIHQPSGIGTVTVDGTTINFSYSDLVNAGDFICYANDSDIYHCPRSIFIERYDLIVNANITLTDLNFSEALVALNAGKSISKRSWPKSEQGDLYFIYKKNDLFFLRNTICEIATMWNPTVDALNSIDWYVFE